MDIKGGGGGGGGMGAQNFVSSAALPKQQSPCSNWISWPTISEFNKFYSPFKIADMFFLVNLVGNVKMHLSLFVMVVCEHYAFPLMEIKWQRRESHFWASFSFST